MEKLLGKVKHGAIDVSISLMNTREDQNHGEHVGSLAFTRK